MISMNIILASASPRRQELLKKIYPVFDIISSDIDESYPAYLPLNEVSVYLAEKKAKCIAEIYKESLVIASDTTVVLNNQILGKPENKADAKRMLRLLSGTSHSVVTAVHAVCKETNKRITLRETTEVTFYPMTDKEIDDYIESGEPMDKAGAYGIQGLGSRFVKEISGDYNNVVGLPVGFLYQALKENRLL
jgi:septum formation protein